MSRSYKKNPGWSDRSRNGTKKDKRYANRKVRNSDLEFSKGSTYKKLSERWEIRDWNFRYYSRDEVIRICGKFYGKKISQAWIT